MSRFLLLLLLISVLFTSVLSIRPRAAPKASFLRSPSSPSTPLPTFPFPSSPPAWNTSTWFGAAYTPSPAGNQLWWHEYEAYAHIVEKELRAVRSVYGFTALRTFIHNMVYDAAPATFIANIGRYLTLCHSLGIKPGFVFFDDCWNSAGATIPDSCVPIKGRHNGCWMQSPQAVQRTNISRFQSYVTDIVSAFRDDDRVLYWEIYNEPNTSNFTQTLRNAAYGWATAVKPVSPVISCWGDNPNTQIVDEHRYDQDFTGWTADVYANPSKGGVVTEGGSRWFQGYDSDAGSTKLVMAWLQALREAYAAGKVPFVPGMIVSWEVNVGNSHTRWHWSTPDNAPEPTIPWDAHIFSDQTPISYTEAGLIRRYTTRHDPFLLLQTFMPDRYDNKRDYFTTMQSDSYFIPNTTAAVIGDGLYEVSFWPNASTAFSIWTHASVSSVNGVQAVTSGYQFTVSLPDKMIYATKMTSASSMMALGNWSFAEMECGVVDNGWNIFRIVISEGEMEIYLNMMATDAAEPFGILPRLSLVDGGQRLQDGVMALSSENGMTRVDYVSVSRLETWGEYVKVPGKPKRQQSVIATQ